MIEFHEQAAAVLDAVAETRAEQHRGDARLLERALEVAELYAVDEDRPDRTDSPPSGVLPATAPLPGQAQPRPPAGVGAPDVSEVGIRELAWALGRGYGAAFALVGDALELRHRLPQTWALVRSGTVVPYLARIVAGLTKPVSWEAALGVDAAIAPHLGGMLSGQVERFVTATIDRLDPATAERTAAAERSRKGVWFGTTVHAVTGMGARLDTADAMRLDAALDTHAEHLAILGHVGGLDERRADRLGVLANPQHALDLTTTAHPELDPIADPMAGSGSGSESGSESGQPGERHGPQEPAVGGSACTCGGLSVSDRARLRRASKPRVVLYVHLSEQAVEVGRGVARLEDTTRIQGCPLSMGDLRRVVGHADVTVKPVVDLPHLRSVDRYEIPADIAEAVRISSPRDYFPYAQNVSPAQDLDHITPYDRTHARQQRRECQQGRGAQRQTRRANVRRLGRGLTGPAHTPPAARTRHRSGDRATRTPARADARCASARTPADNRRPRPATGQGEPGTAAALPGLSTATHST